MCVQKIHLKFSAVFCLCVSLFFPKHSNSLSIQFYIFVFIFSFQRFILYPLKAIWILSFLSHGCSSSIIIPYCTKLFLFLFSSIMFNLFHFVSSKRTVISPLINFPVILFFVTQRRPVGGSSI